MLNTIALLIPVFLLITAVELFISYRQGKRYFSERSIGMNISLGAIFQFWSLLEFMLFFGAMELFYRQFRLFDWSVNWLHWLLAYVAIDFISYWYHRFSHEWNILWAGHVTHHSSEHFNFTNGFRVSPFQGLNRIPFWLILPVLGFSPFVLVVCFKISGVYDFWLHTQTVPKLRWMEWLMVTPSVHRVHHGKNELYLDKNYGSNFVIWDKMFGTYQPETIPVDYGIKDPDYRDDHPVKAIFHHYAYLWQVCKSIPGWGRRLQFLFLPPDRKPEAWDPVLPAPAIQQEITGPGYRYYAYWLLAVGITGVVATMVVQELLPWPVMALFAVLLVSDMVTAALIMSRNLRAGFRYRQWLRMAALSICAIGLWWQYELLWLWLLPLYLGLNGLWIARLQASAQRVIMVR